MKRFQRNFAAKVGCTVATFVFALAQAKASEAEARIVDAAGQGVASARITVFLPANQPGTLGDGETQVVGGSDADGRLRFAFPRTPGGVAVIDAAGFAPSLVHLDGGRELARLVIEPGIELTGALVGDGEVPAGHGSICAVWRPIPEATAKRFTVRRCGTVAESGAWRITALPRGDISLEAEVPGYLPFSRTLVVPAQSLDVNLDPGSRALVLVRTAQGAAVAGATVRCEGAVATPTGDSGEARVALPAASVECEAQKADLGVSAPVAIRAPLTEPQVIRLADYGGLRGQVLGEDGTIPGEVRFDLVEAFEDGSGQRTFAVDPEILPEGRFLLRVHRPGRYALRVQAPGWRVESIDWLELAPGSPVDLGPIVLRRGAGVSGVVLDARTSEAVGGAVVSLRPTGRARLLLGGQAESTVLTDDQGGFVAAGLPIGRFLVEIRGGDLAPWSEEVDLDDESVQDLAVRYLYPFVAVSGSIERDDGSGVAGVRVEFARSFDRDADSVASAHTSGDGHFGALRVGPGRYRVLVRGDRLLLDQEIAVPAREDRFELDLRLRRTRLSGVVLEGGAPIGGGEIVLRPLADLESSLGVVLAKGQAAGSERWSGRPAMPVTVPVDVDGTFVVEDAPTGRLRAAYFGLEGRQATRILDVPDDREATVALEVSGQTVEGTVLDQGSRAGVEAAVELVDADAQTIVRATCDGTGGFRLTGIPSGEYRLFVEARGYRRTEPTPVLVTATGAAPILAELERTDGASLHLVAERPDGTRAAGLPLVVLDAAGNSLRALPADRRGALGLSELPRGRFSIVWSDALAGAGASGPFDLRTSERSLELEIERGRDLIVQCQGEGCEGSRLPWFAIFTEHDVDLAPFLLRSSAIAFSEDGEARVGRLGPGTYRIVAMTAGRRLEKTLEVSSGPGEVELTLPRR